MIYLVIQPHQTFDQEALQALAGAKLRFERKPTKWAGWLWCTDAAGKSGWAPESWVAIDGDTCTLLRNYSAAELTLNIGDYVDGDIIESGWIWVQNRNGDSGWVPLECLSPI